MVYIAANKGNSMMPMRQNDDICAGLAVTPAIKTRARAHAAKPDFIQMRLPRVRLPAPGFGSIMAAMDELEAIIPFRSWGSGPRPERHFARESAPIAFDRKELGLILGIYGMKVADGEWRDYALDFGRDCATFSVFRRASEVPLYRIVKDPGLARKQGLYSVIAQGGVILKRGQDLAQVLRVLAKGPKLRSV